MTGKINHRRAIGIAAAVLTLGVAGPAAARPYDIDSAGSFVPVNIGQPPAVAAPAPVPHANGGGSALEYVLIGTGSATIVLVGVGGTMAASRRRHAGAARRSTLVT